jgi:hypothetical protein
MMFPKYKYFRSKSHLKNVASLPCQNCYIEGETQAAHSNWSEWGNKGRGIKASDEFVAALCQKCHYEVDQGKMSKQEKSQMWYNAYVKTIKLLEKQ